jgi:hypothetical protein
MITNIDKCLICHQGSHAGCTKKKDFEKEFFKKKEGNLRKRRKEGKEGFLQTYSCTRVKID